MTRIIAIVNHKGGVGKTTTTLNLGKALSLSGKKVLLVDMDPQANLSQSVGKGNEEESIYDVLCEDKEPNILHVNGLDLIASNLNVAAADYKLQSEHFGGYKKLKKKLNHLKENYDYILIDCPPSLGVLTINSLAFATDLIIVTEAEYLSIQGLDTIVDLHKKTVDDELNPTLRFLGILFAQVNRTVVNKNVVDVIRSQYKNKVFNTVIRENVRISEASINKQDIFTYDPDSMGAEDYTNFSKEILNHEQ